MRKLAIAAIIFAFTTLITANVYAGFKGRVSGEWTDPVATGTEPVFEGVGTSIFQWGKSTETPPCYLEFNGYSFDNVSAGTPFRLGKITYYNGGTVTGTDASSVTLVLTLDIQSPITVNFNPKFSLKLEGVPNEGTGWDNADYVYFPDSLSEEYFTINGITYKIEIIGFSQDDGATTVNEFHVLEKDEEIAELYGRIFQRTVDSCPYDPDKLSPGICGCGIPDIDTDGDGTMDCEDDCPNDPNKTEPGAEGCGVSEDTDDNDVGCFIWTVSFE